MKERIKKSRKRKKKSRERSRNKLKKERNQPFATFATLTRSLTLYNGGKCWINI